MVFTTRRADGTLEKRQHVQYRVAQTGPAEWCAYRTRDNSLMARDWISEEHLRASCDTCTEPARKD